MLLVRDVRIEAGVRILLDEASFTLQAGDKVGLVGRNGAGKSTMMKTLVGDRAPAAGEITMSGSLAYFSQEAALPHMEHPETTALERVLSARDIGGMQRRIEDARIKLESAAEADMEKALNQFARLQDQFEAAGGYALEAEAKGVAASVGIETDHLDQTVLSMSGGQRRRVELARILFSDSDVMLLDEPTNHLDLDAKTWLMDYLSTYKGALLVVSHDLPLLDQSITSVLSVENARMESYRGNYTHFLKEREARRVQRERERKTKDQKLAQPERRFHVGDQNSARQAH